MWPGRNSVDSSKHVHTKKPAAKHFAEDRKNLAAAEQELDRLRKNARTALDLAKKQKLVPAEVKPKEGLSAAAVEPAAAVVPAASGHDYFYPGHGCVIMPNLVSELEIEAIHRAGSFNSFQEGRTSNNRGQLARSSWISWLHRNDLPW